MCLCTFFCAFLFVHNNEGDDEMSLASHLQHLAMRHAHLDTLISQEDNRPRPDDDRLMRMKLQKLRLKEQMERLRGQSGGG